MTTQIQMTDGPQEESCWGMLVDLESYGRHGDTKHDYKIISYEDAKTEYKEHMHASHGMLYAKNDVVLWELYSTKAAVLMQLRFDGLLGFPGGLVDPGEDPVVGLNREMHEEIALDLNKHSFQNENHVVTFLHEKKKLVLHFYIKEVTLEEFKGIEHNCTQAHEYGIETLGSFRVPLFTMGDNFRGFPAFLCHQFAGNAKEELLCGLVHTKLFTREEIEKALELVENFKLSTKVDGDGGKTYKEDHEAEKERWGKLYKYASYGRHGDDKNDFKIISKHEADTDYADCEHVAHAMLYTEDDRVIWDQQSRRASVLMQVRFDGRLGFPGGHINSGEDTVVGLNREMCEEIGLDVSKYGFIERDYLVTYLHEKKKFILHFFVKKISLQNLNDIERNCTHAHEYGVEALGCVLPPLYTMKGNFKGFPAFLCNQFAGNAKEELFYGLTYSNICTREEIEKAEKFANEFLSN